MKKFFTFTFILVAGICAVSDGKLPPTIPVCSRNHPNLSECISNVVQTLRPRLATGDLGPGFQFPPLEPFFIPQIQYGEERGLKVHLSNIVIKGVSKFKIEKLRVNFNDFKMDLLLVIPKLNLHANYKLSFNFLNAIVKREGDYLGEFEGTRIRASLKGHRYLKDGLEFIKLDPIEVRFQREKVNYIRLTNLGGGSELLSEVIHAIINNNPDFVLKNIYPQVNAYLSKFTTGIAERVFSSSPLEELFPK